MATNDDRNGEGGGERRFALARILLAGALFAIGSVFNRFLHDTPYSLGEYAVLLSAYALVGAPVLVQAARSVARGQVFNEMFLMAVATAGAIAIHQIPEAVAVMLFYSVGEYLQDSAVERSRGSIRDLMDLRPESARILREGRRVSVDPGLVLPGEIVEVLPGERIPLDGTVVEGSSFVNTSSLTGESVPRRVGPGDEVLGGYVNDEGRLEIRVGKEYSRTAVARILELVENASSRKAPTERFITKFASVYTPIVVGLAALVAIMPPLFLPGAAFDEWLYRALVILVISCPCALVVSIPLGYSGGIGGAARSKLLVKGANCLDALAWVDTVVFDKTGTLTEGVFEVVSAVARNGFREDELLGWAAAAESHSSHPIARSIREAAGKRAGAARDIVEVKGHGVIAKVGKDTVLVGNDRFLHREAIPHEDCGAEGTVAYVAVNGKYAGYLAISDRIRPKAAGAVAALKRLGVRKTVMLTGDDMEAASRAAREAGIDEFRAGLLPDEKVAILEALEADPARKGALVFVGDGMNDAPVLMRADVGIAMGGAGSDAAIEAADVVVMDDDISRVPAALEIAGFTRRVVLQNIVFALAVKAAFIVMGSLGTATMWEAVIGDVGVSLLAVFNAMRTARHVPGKKRGIR